jgi:hypothetical protein
MGLQDGRWPPQTDKTPAAKSLYRSIYVDVGIAFFQSNFYDLQTLHAPLTG